jgi:hypothetical protein
MALAVNAGRARADWDGPTTPEIEAWFRKQTNARNDVCCDKTEVARVTDYRFDGNLWTVIVDGVEYHATPEKTTENPNIMGVPLVWFYPRTAERSDETLRCFMRGTEG